MISSKGQHIQITRDAWTLRIDACELTVRCIPDGSFAVDAISLEGAQTVFVPGDVMANLRNWLVTL